MADYIPNVNEIKASIDALFAPGTQQVSGILPQLRLPGEMTPDNVQKYMAAALRVNSYFHERHNALSRKLGEDVQYSDEIFSYVEKLEKVLRGEESIAEGGYEAIVLVDEEEPEKKPDEKPPVEKKPDEKKPAGKEKEMKGCLGWGWVQELYKGLKGD